MQEFSGNAVSSAPVFCVISVGKYKMLTVSFEVPT